MTNTIWLSVSWLERSHFFFRTFGPFDMFLRLSCQNLWPVLHYVLILGCLYYYDSRPLVRSVRSDLRRRSYTIFRPFPSLDFVLYQQNDSTFQSLISGPQVPLFINVLTHSLSSYDVFSRRSFWCLSRKAINHLMIKHKHPLR